MSDRVSPCLKHIHPRKEKKRKKWTTVFIDICQSLKEPKGSNTHRNIQRKEMFTCPVTPHYPSQRTSGITGGNGTFKKQSPVGGHSSHGRSLVVPRGLYKTARPRIALVCCLHITSPHPHPMMMPANCRQLTRRPLSELSLVYKLRTEESVTFRSCPASGV